MKQYARPVHITSSTAKNLTAIPTEKMIYSEGYIQNLCYTFPTLLPVEEIEPIYAGLIPVCKELGMPSGYCDIVYINDNGYLTLVECKLWKNPEARRKVIGQILDYAKDLSSWDYDTLERQCISARKGSETTLIDIVKSNTPDIDEAEFIDRVIHNFKNRSFFIADCRGWYQGKHGRNGRISQPVRQNELYPITRGASNIQTRCRR